MNRVFEPGPYFKVPDGTELSPFLNATDINQRNLPWQALGDMSIAAGRIAAGVRSWIHRHPVVCQVTYLLAGNLRVWMQEPGADEPYAIDTHPGQAVLCEPGTLFQLHNPGRHTAHVLYMVSPSYVFETRNQSIVYDEAIMVARSWEELKAIGSNHPGLRVSTEEHAGRREQALNRLAADSAGRSE